VGRPMVSENNKRSVHTARVRMVLMASSSVFPYGMMGSLSMGKRLKKRSCADVLVFRFCSYSGVARRHACLNYNARVDVLVGSLKARLHQPVAALSAITCSIPPVQATDTNCCFVLVSLRRVLTRLCVPSPGYHALLQVTVHY
jgi:hypothetical protein